MQPTREIAAHRPHVVPPTFVIEPHEPPSATPGGGKEVVVCDACGAGMCVTVVVDVVDAGRVVLGTSAIVPLFLCRGSLIGTASTMG